MVAHGDLVQATSTQWPFDTRCQSAKQIRAHTLCPSVETSIPELLYFCIFRGEGDRGEGGGGGG